MKKEHESFLNLRRLPATIDAEQTAILLNISMDSVTILAAKEFLEPLGKPLAANAPRRFASVEIERIAHDVEELNKMQRILSLYWRSRNGTDKRRRAKPLKSAKSPIEPSFAGVALI